MSRYIGSQSSQSRARAPLISPMSDHCGVNGLLTCTFHPCIDPPMFIYPAETSAPRSSWAYTGMAAAASPVISMMLNVK